MAEHVKWKKLKPGTVALVAGVACAAIIVFACGSVLLSRAVGTEVQSDDNTLVLSAEVFDTPLELDGELDLREGGIVGVMVADEDQVQNIYMGQQVKVSCSELGISTIKGTVSDIVEHERFGTARGFSPAGDTYDVVVALGQLGDEAQAGMSIVGDFELEGDEGLFAVPEQAIGTDDKVGSYVVAVYDDGTSKQIQVTCGASTEDGRVIIYGSALSEGLKLKASI